MRASIAGPQAGASDSPTPLGDPAAARPSDRVVIASRTPVMRSSIRRGGVVEHEHGGPGGVLGAGVPGLDQPGLHVAGLRRFQEDSDQSTASAGFRP